MPTFPTLASASGTRLHVTTTEPATNDQTGWEAIVSGAWSEVGRLTSGSAPRPVRQFNERRQLDGGTFIITGAEQMADIEYNCVFQPDDAGQTIVDGNSDGQSILYWRLTFPNGYKVYFAGYATGYSPTFDDVESEVSANFVVKALFDDQRVGVVRVAPT